MDLLIHKFSGEHYNDDDEVMIADAFDDYLCMPLEDCNIYSHCF